MSHSHSHHHHDHDHKYCSHQLDIKKKKTAWVLLISLVTMVLEISYGYIANSMSLLSDGWHMSSHVVAIGASWLAYHYVLRQQAMGNSVNPSKTLSYVGLLNALVLAIIAVTMIIECIKRFDVPVEIKYREAIVVAIIGLVVNLLSAKILHHDEESTDHNLRATYLHVLADVLTSALALTALIVGFYFDLGNLDTIVGIIGSLVILYWAKSIIVNSVKEIFFKTHVFDDHKH